jgi:hypothetical protein
MLMLICRAVMRVQPVAAVPCTEVGCALYWRACMCSHAHVCMHVCIVDCAAKWPAPVVHHVIGALHACSLRAHRELAAHSLLWDLWVVQCVHLIHLIKPLTHQRAQAVYMGVLRAARIQTEARMACMHGITCRQSAVSYKHVAS